MARWLPLLAAVVLGPAVKLTVRRGERTLVIEVSGRSLFEDQTRAAFEPVLR